MPHYRLVASGRPDVNVDEIVLSRDDSGEVEHSVHVRHAREIPEDILEEAQKAAGRFGYRVEEAPAPEEGEEVPEQLRDAAVDTVGGSPMLRPTGASGAEIDQEAMADTSGEGGTAPQQGSQSAEASGAQTTQGGSPATSQTTSTTPPPTNT